MHCKQKTNYNRLGHLTNQSRVDQSEQSRLAERRGLNRLKTIQSKMQTLSICAMYIVKIKWLFFVFDACKPFVGDLKKKIRNLYKNKKHNGALYQL